MNELYQWSQSQGSNWDSFEMCTFPLVCRPSIASHPMCGCSMDLKHKHTNNQDQFHHAIALCTLRNEFLMIQSKTSSELLCFHT